MKKRIEAICQDCNSIVKDVCLCGNVARKGNTIYCDKENDFVLKEIYYDSKFEVIVEQKPVRIYYAT